MTAMEHLHALADFVVEHYPPARTWEDPVQYCAWFVNRKFLATVRDPDTDEILAVGAARPIERPGLGILPGYYNEGGKCLHIDLLIDITDSKMGIFVLRELCRLRFPQCTVVCMFRHEGKHMRVYPLEKLFRRGERLWQKGKKQEVCY